MNKGIPTKYAHINFRSRLEAHWAHFFDEIDWPWEYEPFDLRGYIPDFVIKFPHAPLLIEVKPCVVIGELLPAPSEKIEKSGWDKEALIVGATLFGIKQFDNLAIGMLGERFPETGELVWGHGLLFRCVACERISVYHEVQSWRCRRCGVGDGDGHLGCEPYSSLEQCWANAKNKVQWKGGSK